MVALRINESSQMDDATRRTFGKIKSLFAQAVPTGVIQMYAGTTAPSGWAVLDGGAISRAANPNLFALVGTTYGVGDGSTTFNVPDMRGRAPIGVGTGSGLTARTLNQVLGEETHLLTGGESGVPVHNHTQNAHNHIQDAHAHQPFGYTSGSGGAWVIQATSQNAGIVGLNNTGNATATNQTATATNIATTAANAASAHNNMQPSLGINFIIKIG